MGALENITDRIKKDATKQAKKSIDEAKSEANKLLAWANSELEKEKKAMELEADKAIKLARSRAVSEAKLEARKIMLAAKEEVITRAFQMAHERLSQLTAEEKERYLRGAIRNAAELLGRDLEVLCNPQDAAIVQRVSKEIAPGSKVISENVNYLGGAMIRARDGSSQLDATFEGLLDRMRNTLRKEVAEMLFSAGAKGGPQESQEV